MSAEGASLDSTVVEKQDNSAETLAAFELQAQEFKQVQNDFSDYMDRLQEDIALKAEKFGHVEFYDARLQDGYSNSMAVAASEVHSLDDRRKPLASTNPLLAKDSVLLPEPNVEDITYEHLSLNLPSIAINALDSVSRIAIEAEIPELPNEEFNDSANEELPPIPTIDDSENEELPPPPVEELPQEIDDEDNGDDEEYDEEEENLPPIPTEEDQLPPIPQDDENK